MATSKTQTIIMTSVGVKASITYPTLLPPADSPTATEYWGSTAWEVMTVASRDAPPILPTDIDRLRLVLQFVSFSVCYSITILSALQPCFRFWFSWWIVGFARDSDVSALSLLPTNTIAPNFSLPTVQQVARSVGICSESSVSRLLPSPPLCDLDS